MKRFEVSWLILQNGVARLTFRVGDQIVAAQGVRVLLNQHVCPRWGTRPSWQQGGTIPPPTQWEKQKRLGYYKLFYKRDGVLRFSKQKDKKGP